jgi:hypothetical protein
MQSKQFKTLIRVYEPPFSFHPAYAESAKQRFLSAFPYRNNGLNKNPMFINITAGIERAGYWGQHTTRTSLHIDGYNVKGLKGHFGKNDFLLYLY